MLTISTPPTRIRAHFLTHLPLIYAFRKKSSCINHHHVDHFDTTYKDSSAFSDTPAMDIRVLHAKGMLLHIFCTTSHGLRRAPPRACMHFLNGLPWFAPRAWTNFLCDLPRIALSILSCISARTTMNCVEQPSSPDLGRSEAFPCQHPPPIQHPLPIQHPPPIQGVAPKARRQGAPEALRQWP